MKIIEMNKRGRYSHTLFGHKVVRLLLAASLQCGLFVPYVFGDNNLHINIMNQDGVVSGLVRDATGMPLIGVSVVVKGRCRELLPIWMVNLVWKFHEVVSWCSLISVCNRLK